MELKVSSKSDVKKVAGAIAKSVRNRNKNGKENEEISIQAIGAGAVNQTVKSIGIAREYLNPEGFDISTTINFTNVEFNGNKETAIKFNIHTLDVENA